MFVSGITKRLDLSLCITLTLFSFGMEGRNIQKDLTTHQNHPLSPSLVPPHRNHLIVLLRATAVLEYHYLHNITLLLCS